jgi:hypothetical protein
LEKVNTPTIAAAARQQKQVGEVEIEREQQRVEDEEAVRAEQPDERRRRERIDERFRVIQPRPDRILELDAADIGKAVRRTPARHLAALQEDPFRSAAVLLPHTREILALEAEIEIAGEAFREAVVGRFVALERLGFARQVDRRRERQQEEAETE